MDPLKVRETKESGCSWLKSSLMFGCARHKLMTHYVHTGTVRDQAVRQALRYDCEKEAVLLCWHTYINAFGRRQYLPDVMDYLPIRSITVCGKRNYLISADRPLEVRLAYVQWARRHFVWWCVDWKPDLHSAVLVVKHTNKRCWDCYVLERDQFAGGSFVVWGGKIGDKKTYFVVMQDNFNALYRRRFLTSCHTIAPVFLHIKNWSVIWNKLKQNKKAIECNVFCVLSFLKGVDILSWKEINAMCR